MPHKSQELPAANPNTPVLLDTFPIALEVHNPCIVDPDRFRAGLIAAAHGQGEFYISAHRDRESQEITTLITFSGSESNTSRAVNHLRAGVQLGDIEITTIVDKDDTGHVGKIVSGGKRLHDVIGDSHPVTEVAIKGFGGLSELAAYFFAETSEGENLNIETVDQPALEKITAAYKEATTGMNMEDAGRQFARTRFGSAVVANAWTGSRGGGIVN